MIDIAPPYDRSWLFVLHLINTSPLAGVPAVFTTTNERHVREAAGPEDVIELVGKPYNLDLLLERVKALAGIRVVTVTCTMHDARCRNAQCRMSDVECRMTDVG